MEIILNNKEKRSLVEKLEDRVEQRIRERGTSVKSSVLKGLLLLSLILLFFMSSHLLRQVDPLSAIVDGGVLMLLLLGAMAVLIAHIWAVWATQSILIELLSMYRTLFDEPIKAFTSWQTILTYGAIYFLLFWSFLWCFSKWL